MSNEVPRIVKPPSDSSPEKKFIRRYRAPRGGFGKVHAVYFRALADQLSRDRDRVELDFSATPDEYFQHCDDGFTVGKAIRDRSGKVVKIDGRISVPDLVDYKEDRIYDLKTMIWSLILCLPKAGDGEFSRFTADEVVRLVVHRNRRQLERYVRAYWSARGRPPVVMLSIEGFDRRIVCGFHQTLKNWCIVEDKIKISTIQWYLNNAESRASSEEA